METGKEHNRIEKFKRIMLLTIIIVLGWVQLEVSCGNLVHIFQMQWAYVLFNIATLYMLFLFVFILCNRLKMSLIIFETVCSVFAIINYYVIDLHGTPLSANEIKNFGTAMNVLQAYKIELNVIVVFILGSFLLSIFVVIFLVKRGTFLCETRSVLKRFLCIIVISTIFWMAYFSSISLKPQKTIGWSWEEAYYKYGFVACSIESVSNAMNTVNKPEGYSKEEVEKIVFSAEKGNENRPDIILILNETFYDLSVIADIETDVAYMDNVKKLENAVTGYAVSTIIGGGTNNSEYEVLTGNSLQLMPGITPFNVLDMNNSNSIVSHLKKCGYNTLAAHSEPASNYMRGKAYPAMGFEKAYFSEKFENIEFYGNRWFETDESLYNNIKTWYEEFENDAPRFMYLLTIQNHAAYDMNDAEEDVVHVNNEWGEYEEDINEFLSCIRLSDIAFGELVDYFKNVEREVVICMVGDHSPSFATKIIDEKYSEDEKNLLLRSTPFVIWSNKGLESNNVGTISMNYLVSTLLETAGVSLSPYYKYMIELKKEVPILTSYGRYYDKDGNCYSYLDTNEYSEMIKKYFYMEYNSLQKDRREELFIPFE